MFADDSSEWGEREAQRHELTLCRHFQFLTLCSLLTCGAQRGEFGDAENDGVGGEEKSAVAAARCFLNSRHERSQVGEHDRFPDHSGHGEKEHGDRPVGRGDVTPAEDEDAERGGDDRRNCKAHPVSRRCRL